MTDSQKLIDAGLIEERIVSRGQYLYPVTEAGHAELCRLGLCCEDPAYKHWEHLLAPGGVKRFVKDLGL